MGVIIASLAALAFYGTDQTILFVLSVVIAILCFLFWCVMYNDSRNSAKLRLDQIRKDMVREGIPQTDIENIDRSPVPIVSADLNSIPDWLAKLNMFFTFFGIVLLIWGIIIKYV